jgi:hypothetical protein
MRSPRTRPRLVSGIVVTVATLLACLGWLLSPGRSGAQRPPADPPVALTLSESTNITDATVIQVTATTRSDVRLQTDYGQGNNPHMMRICRPGVTYATPADMSDQTNCPVVSVSSSSQASDALYPLPNGTAARGAITAGVGTAEWTRFVDGETRTFTLTCDPANPCLLVARFKVSVAGGPLIDVVSAVELHYGNGDPTTACGARDPDQVASGGPDRMRPLWTQLTVAECRAAQSGAPTSFIGVGEGEGLKAFAAGDADLAYTASGYRAVAGLDAAPERPAVYTPIALNAVVIAAIGGQVNATDPNWPLGLPQPYREQIRLTQAEAAALIAQGQAMLKFQNGDAIVNRNPQLGPQLYFLGSGKYTNPYMQAGADSGNYFASSFFAAQAPEAWVTRPGPDGVPRPVSADFSTAQPDFTAALLGVTSRSLLAAGAHNDVQQNPADPGPGWALTDYATAVALGMTPVAIENGSGEFVAPTPETMAAALDGMIHEPDGRLTPDPNASAAGAYPLTTVEYAMAPAEQLVDDSCASRPHAQELLRTWLDYLTGPAQSSLPTGFVALPDSLREQAPAAIAKVGASPTTCGVPAAPGGPGTTPPDRPSATPTASADATARSSAGAGLGAGDGLLDADALALTASAAELAAAADAADAAEPELPPVFGIIPVSRVLAPAALLLTVALTSMAALVTSGRPILPRRRPPAAPG